MAAVVITNNDVGQIAIEVSDFEHHVWTAAGGGDTLVAGTIMARITATGKWGIYDTGGAGGLGIAKGVLTYDVTGAGDTPVAILVRGTVNQDRLVQDDGGAVTHVEIDSLADFGIMAKPVKQLAQLDNQ